MNASKSYLAKLLATENIEIIEGNYHTASFDVVNRVLRLPLWKDMGKNVYDLLIGHEVGHALFTPSEGWHDSEIDVEGIPRSYLNIIEDIRIERAIQKKYPGLVNSFKKGYQVLFDQDFFGTAGRDLRTYQLPDRINIKAKLNDLVEIEYLPEEQALVEKCFAVETWEDVVVAARELHEYMKSLVENPLNDQKQKSQLDSSNQEQEEEQLSGESSSEQSGDPSFDEFFDAQGESSDKAEASEDDVTSGGSGDFDPDSVETDEVFRNRENDLLENESPRTVVINERSIKQVCDQVIGYKKYYNDVRAIYKKAPSPNQYKKFLTETTKVVGVMVKEFERKKAATRYAHAKVSKSGRLDMNKLHSYKVNEDIFSRTMKMADDKNHGMVMLIDKSGSMMYTIGPVIRQALNLALFCRKANIPFEVYTFTDRTRGKIDNPKSNEKGDLETTGLAIIQILSSDMSKKEFDYGFQYLYDLSQESYFNYSLISPSYDVLGGTPLNEVLIGFHKLLPEFKKRHNLDKVSLNVLTDGDANTLGITNCSFSNRAKIKLFGKIIDMRLDERFESTVSLLNSLKKGVDATVCIFDLVTNNPEINRSIYRAIQGNYFLEKEAKSKFRKEKVFVKTGFKGLDAYFVMLAGEKAEAKSDEFSVEEGAKKGALAREFKKFTNSKKYNRSLVTTFTDIIS